MAGSAVGDSGLIVPVASIVPGIAGQSVPSKGENTPKQWGAIVMSAVVIPASFANDYT